MAERLPRARRAAAAAIATGCALLAFAAAPARADPYGPPLAPAAATPALAIAYRLPPAAARWAPDWATPSGDTRLAPMLKSKSRVARADPRLPGPSTAMLMGTQRRGPVLGLSFRRLFH
ncbi:hypothetical protein [Sphingomonas morindae]|uniref:Uncharacterized protein n=1 Tax=Sphingomonas morindae TaxID=1541170 RepID=A0ABY4X4T1_9SPHN|nr:hypothetical protein [Sphingomonas morindae]USI71907.1 hypothetical protein LHA26_11320 [Sphingomonas morindae]